MTTKELLYVKTVADEHNISKAAKKLFMAQPSLSQSIQRIEESIGMPLFHRTTTGLTLTFAGERYYHMAAQVVGNADVDTSCFQIIDIADFQLKILIHF